MNVHIPEDIRNKYPHMEFRGKQRILKDRTVIEAINHTTDMRFFYSIEEDFFWFSDQIPDWKLPKTS